VHIEVKPLPLPVDQHFDLEIRNTVVRVLITAELPQPKTAFIHFPAPVSGIKKGLYLVGMAALLKTVQQSMLA
jgi:hypothetical protein